MRKSRLSQLLVEVRACRTCTDALPEGPRPIVQWGSKPRVIVVGQAPGAKVHASGIPWDDDSGDHLREWLALPRETFYDPTRIGLLPMGFCYPGKKAGGDAPPDPRCAPQWHEPLLAHAGAQPLILLVGTYAQAYYLGAERKRTLADTVRAFEQYLARQFSSARYFPLPHPSWRSKVWIKKNPWFSESVLPRLRQEVGARC